MRLAPRYSSAANVTDVMSASVRGIRAGLRSGISLCVRTRSPACTGAAMRPFGKLFDHLSRERRQVRRLPRRYDAAIDDDLFIHPLGPGIQKIGFYRRVRRHSDATNDASLHERPGAVADHGDRLAVVEELSHQPDGFRVHSESIRIHDPTWQEQRVVVVRARLIEPAVDGNAVAPFCTVPPAHRLRFGRNDVHGRTGAFERLAWLKQLDLLEAIGNECRDSFLP